MFLRFYIDKNEFLCGKNIHYQFEKEKNGTYKNQNKCQNLNQLISRNAVNVSLVSARQESTLSMEEQGDPEPFSPLHSWTRLG